MKVFAFIIATLALIQSAVAVPELKSVIVWFDTDVADHIIESAKDRITSAGGSINHVYNIIKYALLPGLFCV